MLTASYYRQLLINNLDHDSFPEK